MKYWFNLFSRASSGALFMVIATGIAGAAPPQTGPFGEKPPGDGDEDGWRWTTHNPDSPKDQLIEQTSGVFGANEVVHIKGYLWGEGEFTEPTTDKLGYTAAIRKTNKPTSYFGCSAIVEKGRIEIDAGLKWVTETNAKPGNQSPGWKVFCLVTWSTAYYDPKDPKKRVAGNWKLETQSAFRVKTFGKTLMKFGITKEGKVYVRTDYKKGGTEIWQTDPVTVPWGRNFNPASASFKRVLGLTQTAMPGTTIVQGTAGHVAGINYHNAYVANCGFTAKKLGTVIISKVNGKDVFTERTPYSTTVRLNSKTWNVTWPLSGSSHTFRPDDKNRRNGAWVMDFDRPYSQTKSANGTVVPLSPKNFHPQGKRGVSGAYEPGYVSEVIHVDLGDGRRAKPKGSKTKPSKRARGS